MTPTGSPAKANEARRLVDHLFRRQAGRLSAALTRVLGPGELGLVEDIVQEALLQALRTWPYKGIPENPRAWLLTVARNRALDQIRRRDSFRGKEESVREFVRARRGDGGGREASFSDELSDDQLAMIFTCCHPALPRASRVALTLKTVCAFSVPEVARALLAAEGAVAQRIVRAKRKIREEGIPFEVPGPERIGERLDSVLEVVYLLFNEGYAAHRGESLVRRDLAGEAVRLARLMARHPRAAQPRVDALAALLCLHAARLPARQRSGEMVLMADQDRSLWDRRLISAGLGHLRRSMRGDRLSRYHMQAGIAACHARAPSYQQTDWPEILRQYDLLVRLQPSPLFLLNRAVAVSFVQGPRRGLEEIDALAADPALKDYYLLPAVRADLERRAGHLERAADEYRKALDLPCSKPERRFLKRQLEGLKL